MNIIDGIKLVKGVVSLIKIIMVRSGQYILPKTRLCKNKIKYNIIDR